MHYNSYYTLEYNFYISDSIQSLPANIMPAVCISVCKCSLSHWAHFLQLLLCGEFLSEIDMCQSCFHHCVKDTWHEQLKRRRDLGSSAPSSQWMVCWLHCCGSMKRQSMMAERTWWGRIAQLTEGRKQGERVERARDKEQTPRACLQGPTPSVQGLPLTACTSEHCCPGNPAFPTGDLGAQSRCKPRSHRVLSKHFFCIYCGTYMFFSLSCWYGKLHCLIFACWTHL